MVPSAELPFFDLEACGRSFRTAAAVCAALVVSSIVILLANPQGTASCPGWRFSDGHSETVWIFVVFAGICAAWICNVAIRWRHYSQVILRRSSEFEKRLEQDPTLASLTGFDQIQPRYVLTDGLAIAVLVGWCLACSIPVAVLFFKCSGWLN